MSADEVDLLATSTDEPDPDAACLGRHGCTSSSAPTAHRAAARLAAATKRLKRPAGYRRVSMQGPRLRRASGNLIRITGPQPSVDLSHTSDGLLVRPVVMNAAILQARDQVLPQ